MRGVLHRLAIAALLLFRCTLLPASGDIPIQMRLGSEYAPLATVCDCVNLISGNFFWGNSLATIEGPAPFQCAQYYDSAVQFAGDTGSFALGLPLRLGNIRVPDCRRTDSIELLVEERVDAYFPFKGTFHHGNTIDATIDPVIFNHGYTNYYEGMRGAQSIKNSRLHLANVEQYPENYINKHRYGDCTITLGSGGSRHYHYSTDTIFSGQFWRLGHERKPNGHLVHMSYELEGWLARVCTSDASGNTVFNWMDVEKTPDGFSIKNSNNHSTRCRIDWLEGKAGTGSKHKIYSKAPYVTEIVSSHAPSMKFDYILKLDKKDARWLKLSGVTKPDGRFLGIEYHPKSGQVTRLSAPLGKNGTAATLATFVYHNGATDYYDALQQKTTYRISPQRTVTAIERYTGIGNKTSLYSSERFVWGTSQNNFGALLFKGLANAQGLFVSYTNAAYDDRSNLIKETAFGNFSGEGPAAFSLEAASNPTELVEHISTDFTYSADGYNLLLEERHSDDKHVSYCYQPDSNLLLAKLSGCHGQILSREFYSYDQGVQCIATSDDGCGHSIEDLTGVTQRKIIRTVRHPGKGMAGLPQTISEGYLDLDTGIERQLRRVVYHYSSQQMVEREDVYDADDALQYHLTYEHDEKGLLVSKTDAIGQTSRFRYDANRNRIYEELIGSGFCTYYQYDYCNRLIAQEQKHEDGTCLLQRYIYDNMGQKIASIDHRGHETRYVYDELGRLTQTSHPLCRAPDGTPIQGVVNRAYNIQGHVISETDENGFTTHTRYNVRGQPVAITYPDSSQEKFLYNLNGTLAKKWTKSGLCECYEYDGLDRPVATSSYDTTGQLVQRTRNIYQGANLICSIDPMGYATHFAYDGAGRKTAESKEISTGFSKTTYHYDSLGRLAETKQWLDDQQYVSHIEVFDALNRVIEKRIEDASGQLYHKERCAYSLQGDKTHTYVYDGMESCSLTQVLYDSQRRPIVQINAMGHVTQISYDDYALNAFGQKVLCKMTTDPIGNVTIELHDPMERLVSFEKRNAQDQRTAFHELTYDACGRKIKQVEHILSPDGPRHAFVIDWQLDSMGRPLTIRESGDGSQKITQMTYNTRGQLTYLTKPSGIVLEHTYDDLGRLFDLTSTDQTTAYTYRYDANDQMIEVIDRLTQKVTTRAYDAWDRLVEEHLANGLSVGYRYDALGRLIHLRLPDGSAIAYHRSAAHLLSVARSDANGSVRYAHGYSEYNLKGQARQMSLIGNAGDVSIAWDPLDRRVGISSAYWNETILPDDFDAAGNLRGQSIEDPLGVVPCSYDYDDLYQLNKEAGVATHVYAHDSIQNRLQKDQSTYQVNGLNQLTEEARYTYTYDADGNLSSKQGADVDQRYSYDALNRLIVVEEAHQWKVGYRYDALGRRLTRAYFRWQGDWVHVSTENVLYQDQKDIGTYEGGLCKHLRLLGTGKGAELGAAIAIELYEEVFAPVHDHRGNVCCLINASTGQLAEFYRYTAFGETTIFGCEAQLLPGSACDNPWQYASKRWDSATQLWQFGKRDYDSRTGRWMTPDPLGFADGPNLYAYVHNNPLTLFDPWGLAGETAGDRHQCQSWMSAFKMQTLCSFGGLFGTARNACSGMTHEMFSAFGNYGMRPLAEFSQLADNFVQRVGFTSRRNLDGAPCGPPMETHDRLFARGHGLIDGLFGTNLAQNYSHEALAAKQANCAMGTLPGPASLAPSSVLPVKGYTRHGLNQAIGRDGGAGVNIKEMLRAITHPKKVMDQANGAKKYVGDGATVILNADGKVVTTFGKPRGPKIWDESGVIQP